MTATPIPRSLALTLYGDLDLSILDEMPPGRKPINTYLLAPMDHERAYNLIRKQVDMGFQAFIVYPLIEDSESNESMSAVDEHNRLQSEIFPNYKIGLLHGRLKPDEKEEVMRRFRDRDYQILVSTTVIEVGVDIPNANVMLIEGANRYGLAQLHQLRGRVGRGAETSFCLLIPDRADTLENERLQAMATTNDGFTLAEKDLAQRGPGEFLGTRQSGYAKFHFANIMDAHLIEKAHQQVQTLLDQDSELQQPENQLLAQELAQFWNNIKGDVS
jgi:ATP-dependent DNA helicase RecG